MMIANWKYFEIGKLFPQIYKASAYNAQDLIASSAVDRGAIRYITRTDTNNGCKTFVNNENFTQIEEGNAITIGDTTATIYYQSEQFMATTSLYFVHHFLMRYEEYLLLRF